MKKLQWMLFSAGLLAGCKNDGPPPPYRADVPPVGTYSESYRAGDVRLRQQSMDKPLPAQEPVRTDIMPPYVDDPLITQAPPEQGAFVGAYNAVGHPRITLFINRSLEGQIIPTNPGRRLTGVENVRETTGSIKMESSTDRLDAWGRPIDQRTDKFETNGPAKITDRTEVYLAPGQYDEVQAKRIDYDAVENILTDWLAAGGKVSMISPRLSEAQIREIQKGNRNVLNELSKDNQIDVLIQVQAHATRQTPAGLEVRLVAEAMNTMGGESIGRAVVDIPPPLEKPVINEYTRFLARKLMSDMSRTWSNAPSPAKKENPKPAIMPTPVPNPDPMIAPPSTQP